MSKYILPLILLGAVCGSGANAMFSITTEEIDSDRTNSMFRQFRDPPKEESHSEEEEESYEKRMETLLKMIQDPNEGDYLDERWYECGGISNEDAFSFVLEAYKRNSPIKMFNILGRCAYQFDSNHDQWLKMATELASSNDPDKLKMGGVLLYFACEGGHKDIAEILLKNPLIPVNMLPDKLCSAINVAMYHETALDILELILRYRPNQDFNEESDGGVSPLVQAIIEGGQSTVEFLLTKVPAAQIDINRMDQRGYFPIGITVIDGCSEIFNMLLKDPRLDITKAYKDDDGKFIDAFTISLGLEEWEIAKSLFHSDRFAELDELLYESPEILCDWMSLAAKEKSGEITALLEEKYLLTEEENQ